MKSPAMQRRTLKLEITGRHVKVTPALRTFVKDKLTKVRKLVDGPLEVHAILTVEKHRHIAEVVAHGRHLKLSAREATSDMYTSIGESLEKLETQARKHKEKHSARRRRGAIALSAEPPVDEQVRPVRRAARPGAATEPPAIPRIVRTSVARRKPMSVEEAAIEVQDAAEGFIVFRNDRSQEINILYRRKDGKLGLIEPEG